MLIGTGKPKQLRSLKSDRYFVTVHEYKTASLLGAFIMAEITYYPEVECSVTPGLLDNMITVGVPDDTGNRQYLQVGKGLVFRQGGKNYLAIGIVDLDYREKKALIELPQEADSGANRLWVPFSYFRQESDEP